MCTHLLKIPGSSSYYFRRKIPEDLIAHYNKKEIKKSLRTSDKREAERLARIEGTRLDLEFEALRQPSTPTIQINASPQVPNIPALRHSIVDQDSYRKAMSVVSRYVASQYQGQEQNMVTQSRVALDTWRMQRDLCADTDFYEQFMESLHSTLSTNEYILTTGDQNFYPDKPQPLWVAEALRNAARAFLNGETPLAWEHPKDVRQQTTGKTLANTESNTTELSLLALTDKWADERQPILKTINMANRTVQRFRELVGVIAPHAITRQNVIQFKDKLLASGQTPVNTEKQLNMLKTLLNYAADNAIIALNPAVGVSITVVKQERPRTSFDAPALNAVFHGPVYSDGLRPEAGAGEAAYWLPLLALFTGARLEEIGQLHPSDVYEEPYFNEQGEEQLAWVVRFKTSETLGQQVKNSGSNRRVPLHAELIRLGFLTVAQSAKEKNQKRIFDLLIADKYGNETAQFSKWFGRYLRKNCKILDKRMTFHSFRHTFKDLCRQEEIAVSDVLTGHASGNVGDKYGGDTYPLRPLVNGVKKFRVPGLSLKHLKSNV
ncbi:site-specific integrase [Herbaspirillum seropedicae]|uniref:site-specific integrase n=1 Tax=Herbaspirillum seropedicae TaxID=964 RepID=UPI0015DE8AE2|nr:site-specific integrase [Herbaspirillum seropedicae]